MRIFKIFLILFIFILFTTPVFANKLFYELNKDLRRIGLDELLKMSEIEFESGNYRLDPDFKLGYGDVLILNFWGKLEASYTLTINREGNIVIPPLGKISVIGLTLQQARSLVNRELNDKYSNVEFDLNLADVQDIRITVLGSVENPGPYAVTPFCRLVEAVTKSGGPDSNGSLVEIQLIRDGKQYVSFNIYDFIFKGDESKNVRLKHGDSIYIPLVKNLIAVRGDVAYPGIYEVQNNTKLSSVINIAGGLLPSELKRKLYVSRINPNNNTMEVHKEVILDASGINPKDDIVIEYGDNITITNIFDVSYYPEDLFRLVYVSGGVILPGDYLIKKSETLSSVIKRAGGFKDSAFVQGAIFTRDSVKQKQESILEESVRAQEKAILEEEARLAEESMITEEEKEMRRRALEKRRKILTLMASRVPKGRIIIDLEGIINGKEDIVLEKGDSLYVPPIPNYVLVTGAVYNPESIAFKQGKPLEYYLNAIGGPNKFADKDNIYIIKADGSVQSKSIGYGKISRGDIIVVPEKIE